MMSYVMQIMMSVMMASFLAMMAPRASVCAERILEVLGTESSVHAPDAPIGFSTDPATAEFSGAEFRYPGADSPVLSDISFRITPGTTTAIVGSTGAAKPPCSTSSRGSSTSPTVRCPSAAPTCGNSTPTGCGR